MTDAANRLNVFAPLTKDAWIAKVEADLKGGSLEGLRSTIPGGLEVEPLYTAQDVDESVRLGGPGQFPYVRGSKAVGAWTIRQEYDGPLLENCAQRIARDQARGVEALWIRLGTRHGCRVVTVDDLDQLLASVDLGATSICLDAGADAMPVAAAMIAVAERRGVGADRLDGCFGLDPIGLLASSGGIEGGLQARFAELRDLAAWTTAHGPSLRAVCVSTHPFHQAAAGPVGELAIGLATGVEYLRQLIGAGLSIDDAARQLWFAFSVGSNFFTEIAKLRAARWLWAKALVLSGADPSASSMQLHARTSAFTKTQRDPWVNMLRATAECTAAVLGGAQSVSTLPFDSAIGPPSELSERVARNTQIVLREESHLGSVADPAGGSWYVEALTAKLARAAWAEFQTIEGKGGILEELSSGRLNVSIGRLAEAARGRVASRKTPIVGVSEFPNLDEEKVECDAPAAEELDQRFRAALQSIDAATHQAKLIAIARVVKSTGRKPGELTDVCVSAAMAGADLYSVGTVLRHGQPDFHLDPVSEWRQAEGWERLRDRSDRHLEHHGRRPTAFLANLGSIPAHKARSAWARNLLSAAGIASVSNDGFGDPAAVADAFDPSSASMAVICGSDADYETMLEPAVASLKAAGWPIVVVAGRPGEREGTLRETGVHDFIFVGADVLEVMRKLIDAIGVER